VWRGDCGGGGDWGLQLGLGIGRRGRGLGWMGIEESMMYRTI